MSPETRTAKGNARAPAASARLDVIVIVVWLCVLATIAFARRSYDNDGMRTVVDGLTSPRPHLYTTRWLLFPSALWMIERPLALLGVVRDFAGAEIAFSCASLGCGAAYLFALRRWLIVRGEEAHARAAALLLAGATVPFLKMTTDNFEPTIAVTIAVVGLSWAAARAGDPSRARSALLVAVASVAAAGLVYQATVLSIAFVPLAIPPRVLRALLREGPTLAMAASVLAVMPLVSIAALASMRDDSLAHAAFVFMKGDGSELFRSYPRPAPHDPLQLVMVAAFGPSANVASLSGPAGFPGVRTILALLEAPLTRLLGLANLIALSVGVALAGIGALSMARRREWPWFLALGGIVLLPMVRTNQWAYTKFYLLLPVLVAMGGAKAPPKWVACAAALLVFVNGGALLRLIQRGRVEYAAAASFYPTLPPEACFLSAVWTPEQELWKGKQLPFLGAFTTHSQGTDAGGTAKRAADFVDQGIRDCFCASPLVVTDEFDADGLAGIELTARVFRYDDLDPATLLWTPEAGVTLPNQPSTMHAYSPAAQSRICAAVHDQLTSRTLAAAAPDTK